MSAHRLNNDKGSRCICEVCDARFVGENFNHDFLMYCELRVRPRTSREFVRVCTDCYQIVTRRVPWYRPSAVVSA